MKKAAFIGFIFRGGGADCHSQCTHWLRNDIAFLQGVRYKAGRVVREADPYGCVTRCAAKRADVGSELSAAGGRGSEVSEWPRSKLGASAVRQRRNFGHRNRIIGPYGEVIGSTVGRTEASAPTEVYLAVRRGGALPLPRAG